MPKWGISKGDYSYDLESRTIAKGLSSIKGITSKTADKLFNLAAGKKYYYFIDVLNAVYKSRCADSGQINTLIKLDFFIDFGYQNALLEIVRIFSGIFNKGNAKQISKEKIANTILEEPIKHYSTDKLKNGEEAKKYTFYNISNAMHEAEEIILKNMVYDTPNEIKAKNSVDLLGYMGYISGKAEDRRKLYILDIYPLRRRSDNKQFGYSVITKSIGSGKESRFTVYNRVFHQTPIHKGEVIFCDRFSKENTFFVLDEYYILLYNTAN